MCKSTIRERSNNNAKIGYGVNKKMNADTYALRRIVIDCIYELKRTTTAIIPRIDVRITDKPRCSNHTGLATLNGRNIWIPENTLKFHKDVIYEVVAHEVLHAVLGIEHISDCPLMSPYHSIAKPMTKEAVNEHFTKYFAK